MEIMITTAIFHLLPVLITCCLIATLLPPQVYADEMELWTPWHEWGYQKPLTPNLVMDVNDKVVSRAAERDGLNKETVVEHEPYAPTILLLEADTFLDEIDWDHYEHWMLDAWKEDIPVGSDEATFFGKTVYDDTTLEEDFQTGATWTDRLWN